MKSLRNWTKQKNTGKKLPRKIQNFSPWMIFISVKDWDPSSAGSKIYIFRKWIKDCQLKKEMQVLILLINSLKDCSEYHIKFITRSFRWSENKWGTWWQKFIRNRSSTEKKIVILENTACYLNRWLKLTITWVIIKSKPNPHKQKSSNRLNDRKNWQFPRLILQE